MPRQGLDPGRVVAAAADIADAEGLEAVTLARVAGGLGVRPPSLYVHVAGLPALRRELSLLGVRELTEAMRTAAIGRSGRAVAPGDDEHARLAADGVGVFAAGLGQSPSA